MHKINLYGKILIKEETTIKHERLTRKFIKTLDRNSDLKRLVGRSLELAKKDNPDKLLAQQDKQLFLDDVTYNEIYRDTEDESEAE